MIARKEILENRVLSLVLKSKKARNTKFGYIYQRGVFCVGVERKASVFRRAKTGAVLEVRINGSSQECKPKVIDDFKTTRALLKKEMEKLMGRKLNPKSKSMEKLDEIAKRHVVLELKPIRGS